MCHDNRYSVVLIREHNLDAYFLNIYSNKIPGVRAAFDATQFLDEMAAHDANIYFHYGGVLVFVSKRVLDTMFHHYRQQHH